MSLPRGLSLTVLSILLLLPGLAHDGHGQDITVDIQLRDPVTEAQVLSLSTLGVDRRGQGNQLGTLLIQNNSGELQENLYFFVKVENTSNVLARLDQEQGQPFSLDPGQVIRTTNNGLQEGIPGIENPTFDGGLTDAGEDFVNDLKGQSQLPNDQFTLTLSIYQGANRPSGGTRVATASATVGASPVTNVRDVYINRPGGEVGGGLDATINTERPSFNWSGETGIGYRVVVVRKTGMDSPETLISSAEGTGPILVDGRARSNTLLDHEMADVQLSSNSFQYPASSVKKLQPGQTYFWRVTALLKTADGQQEVPSEIWKFSIAESQTQQQTTEMTEEMARNLRDLMGGEQFSALQGENFNPQSVVIDGQEYSGQAMQQKLRQFVNRAKRGEITIVRTEE